MRGRVIPHRGFPDICVNDGIHFVAAADALLGGHLMCTDALDRVVTTRHLGNDGIVILGVEPSTVSDLAACLGVKRRVIENDLAIVSRLKLAYPLGLANDRGHL